MGDVKKYLFVASRPRGLSIPLGIFLEMFVMLKFMVKFCLIAFFSRRAVDFHFSIKDSMDSNLQLYEITFCKGIDGKTGGWVDVNQGSSDFNPCFHMIEGKKRMGLSICWNCKNLDVLEVSNRLFGTPFYLNIWI